MPPSGVDGMNLLLDECRLCKQGTIILPDDASDFLVPKCNVINVAHLCAAATIRRNKITWQTSSKGLHDRLRIRSVVRNKTPNWYFISSILHCFGNTYPDKVSLTHTNRKQYLLRIFPRYAAEAPRRQCAGR